MAQRMGHINFDNMVKISSTHAIRDLPKIIKPTNTLCKKCQMGKQTRTSFKEYSFTKSMELIHIDLCGPTRTKGLNGERYFMFVVDDYSRMTWVTFFREKSKALDNFKVFKSMGENEVDSKIKFLRSNRGGQFTSNEYEKFCENHGIMRHLSTPRTPQQNGVVERKNRCQEQC